MSIESNQKSFLENLFSSLSPEQQREVKQYGKANRSRRTEMARTMSVQSLSYLNTKYPPETLPETQVLSQLEQAPQNQAEINSRLPRFSRNKEKLVLGGLIAASNIALLALAAYVSSQWETSKVTLNEQNMKLATLVALATNEANPTALPTLGRTLTATPSETAVPTGSPTEKPTEKPSPMPPTAAPTSEPTKSKEFVVDSSAVWPGELNRSDFWKGENDPDVVTKKIIEYEIANAGNLDNSDSFRTSIYNLPTSLRPLSTRFTPGQPVKEAGFGLTLENLRKPREAKKLGNILEKNSNDIYSVLVYSAANDRDWMATYLAAGILAKQDPSLAEMTFDELLEKLWKGEFKKAGELARLQAMILNQTQESYLGTSEGEKNRRSDPKSGDLSGLLPEQFRKPDQFRTCDVRRSVADERKNQPQYILDGVNHIENGKNTRYEADNVKEGTILIVSSDATGKKFIVGQFTNRKVTAPEKEYKNNSLSPDAPRGAQEMSCGKGQVAPAKTAAPDKRVTPVGKPESTPPIQVTGTPDTRITPTPKTKTPEPTPTNVATNHPNTAPTWTPEAPGAKPTDVTYPTVVPTPIPPQPGVDPQPTVVTTDVFGGN